MTDGENQGPGAGTDVVDAPGTGVAPVGEGGPPATQEPASPPMLPGEVRPHPTPMQYVTIGAVLVVLTALEIGLYYLEGDISENLIIALLLVLAAGKFFLVASWYMHLRTDRPIFRRFFLVGIVAALVLYLIVLLTLHVFD